MLYGWVRAHLRPACGRVGRLLECGGDSLLLGVGLIGVLGGHGVDLLNVCGGVGLFRSVG